MSENKNAEEKRRDFMKRVSDLYDEVRKSGDKEFSVLLIAVSETAISTEHGNANALTAS